MNNQKLTPFFKEVIELRWSEFHQLEQGESHTSAQAIVFAVIRACAKGKLPAIKESLNRIDGKLQEQIEVEYPKFYVVFPHATGIESGKKHEVKVEEGEMHVPEGDGVMTIGEPEPLVTGSLRDTLKRMSNEPKFLVSKILEAAADVESRQNVSNDHEPLNDPLVKSVIVAGLLKMAHNGSLNAIFEVFDNLDGKLVDKIKVLGEDVYLTSYNTIAPVGAEKNKDGVYQLEADNTTSKWALGFEKGRGNNKGGR